MAGPIKAVSFELPPSKGVFLNSARNEDVETVVRSPAGFGKAKPIFSVVIPTHNRHKLLEGALDSLASQNFPKNLFEIIVVDDGSTDLTQETIENFIERNRKIAIIYVMLKKNSGPSVARNHGIKFSKGRLVAFTDDDCIVPTDWLSFFEKRFEEYPDLAGAGGWKIQDISQETIFDRFIYWRRHPYMRQEFLSSHPHSFNNCGDTANVCYKREILMQVGGFDPGFRYLEDWDLKMRIHSRNLPLLYFPKMVTHRDKTGLIRFIHRQLNFGWESFLIQAAYPGYSLLQESFMKFMTASYRESKTALWSETAKFYFIPLAFFRNFLLWLGKYWIPFSK